MNEKTNPLLIGELIDGPQYGKYMRDLLRRDPSLVAFYPSGLQVKTPDPQWRDWRDYEEELRRLRMRNEVLQNECARMADEIMRLKAVASSYIASSKTEVPKRETTIEMATGRRRMTLGEE